MPVNHHRHGTLFDGIFDLALLQFAAPPAWPAFFRVSAHGVEAESDRRAWCRRLAEPEPTESSNRSLTAAMGFSFHVFAFSFP